MKNVHVTALMLAVAATLAACSGSTPPAEAPRPVRTTEVRYDAASEARRYAATVQSRYEVEQAFRVGGKVVRRLVEVGQTVREGDVLAVLDDSDYRLAEEAASQQWAAAVTHARQAESDRTRLNNLKGDGSVSAADDERARTGALTALAAAEAQGRQLELARNRVKYTTLRASRSGVVTAVRFEVGQVVPEGLPVVAIADPGTPEIVVDVPEDQLAAFKRAKFKATLTSTPNESFEVSLRELAPQAAAQTRTYRARLKPVEAGALPLGATATLSAHRVIAEQQVAQLPASALTQMNGQPAVWVAKRDGQGSVANVSLIRVTLHGFRNEEALVSGVPAGELVVTAGVHKLSPGLQVMLPSVDVAEAKPQSTQQAAR